MKSRPFTLCLLAVVLALVLPGGALADDVAPPQPVTHRLLRIRRKPRRQVRLRGQEA
jgi:hypothetical protein